MKSRSSGLLRGVSLGRFGETYYWDTYWTIKGLIACEMLSTAKGVVQNLLDAWPIGSGMSLKRSQALIRTYFYIIYFAVVYLHCHLPHVWQISLVSRTW